MNEFETTLSDEDIKEFTRIRNNTNVPAHKLWNNKKPIIRAGKLVKM